MHPPPLRLSPELPEASVWPGRMPSASAPSCCGGHGPLAPAAAPPPRRTTALTAAATTVAVAVLGYGISTWAGADDTDPEPRKVTAGTTAPPNSVRTRASRWPTGG
ncbi:hypothetical protein ACFV80_18540 [Streptomyces sp. NPDC059862]|uniref:hypothetical protein n=1 Tax=Streptomyces sp. NPDC059862 TaxID=3346975 RepID=UPI003654276F